MGAPWLGGWRCSPRNRKNLAPTLRIVYPPMPRTPAFSSRPTTQDDGSKEVQLPPPSHSTLSPPLPWSLRTSSLSSSWASCWQRTNHAGLLGEECGGGEEASSQAKDSSCLLHVLGLHEQLLHGADRPPPLFAPPPRHVKAWPSK